MATRASTDADPASHATFAEAADRLARGQRGDGPGAAAKAVAEAATGLVRAEIELAKAQATESLRAKGTGIGMLLAAAVTAWLVVQAALVTAGLALAVVLPGWAAAGIVTAVLMVVALVLALVGRKLLATPFDVEATKQNVEEDIEWTKHHLRS